MLSRALAPLGRALEDYSAGRLDATLLVRVEDEPDTQLPAAYFFRTPAEMGSVDRAALSRARGLVLDVGAGAGAHALPLVQQGLTVTALDLLPQAVRILRGRGVEDARQGSVWTFSAGRRYDTILALMNGTGLAGTLGRLGALLEKLGELVAPGGQLLLDSTDLGAPDGEPWPGGPSPDGQAPGAGELHYQLEYAGRRGPPFPQLFVSEVLLQEVAGRAGWASEVVARDGQRYLACLTPS